MKSNNAILIAVLVVTVAVLAFMVYGRRSPGEKAGESIREAGRDLKEAIDSQTPAEGAGSGITGSVRNSVN